MPNIKESMGSREWAMLIALSVLWGGSFFFTGVIIGDLPPLTITALRVGLAAVALWVYALTQGLSPPKDVGLWRALTGMALLNNVMPFYLTV